MVISLAIWTFILRSVRKVLFQNAASVNIHSAKFAFRAQLMIEKRQLCRIDRKLLKA